MCLISVGSVQFLLSFARQWVAGVEAEDAIGRSREANSLGMGAIVNLLGEHYGRKDKVEATAREYESLLADMRGLGLDACISIKLTQLGLSISEGYCREVMARLLEGCRKTGIFLWLDMEGSEYTSATLRIYRKCLESWPEIGVALQANLRRTEEDLRSLLPEGVIRLCKGAYRENPSLSFRKRADVDESYRGLMHILFEDGERFALATHDDRLIHEGLSLQKKHSCELEFQMLLGVRDPLKRELKSLGHRVLEYIPYGPEWLPYFSRRIRERPGNLITMFRSFVGTQQRPLL